MMPDQQLLTRGMIALVLMSEEGLAALVPEIERAAGLRGVILGGDRRAEGGQERAPELRGSAGPPS